MNEKTNTNAGLEVRLASARERKRVAEEKATTASREGALLAAVEAAENEASDAEAVERASAEFGEGKFAIVRTSLGCVIVKRPNHILYKRFRDKESSKTSDLEILVRPCIVHPSADKFDAILDAQPATLDHVADQVVYLAGFRKSELAGK